MTDRLHIGVDARWIFDHMSGIGIYTQELIRHLAVVDRRNRYTLFFNRADLRDKVMRATGVDPGRFEPVLIPYGVFSLAGQWRLPGDLRRLQLDVFHSPNFMIPLPAFPRRRPGAIACVTTLHDLIPLLFPEFAPRSKKSRFYPVYRRIMNEVALRSTLILTDSDHSRRDVLDHLKVPGDQVRAVPIGVSPVFSAAPRPAATRDGAQLLYIGRMDPYKNLAGVIRVLARLNDLLNRPVGLRIVGPPDARYPEAAELAKTLGVEALLRWDGYLPDEELPLAYRQADVLILLSRYEGFGLPVVEAMASGTPVVCSNVSSLPEIAGDAALLVAPDDVEGAAQAVAAVLRDPQKAETMRHKGLEQAARFSWEKTARETLAAYEEAARRRRP